MLARIRVADFALLEDVEIELGPGLNVLTGETGAGKTLLLRAIDLAFGARGAGEVVRAGRPQSRIGVTVRLDGGEIARTVRGLGFEQRELTVQRDITKNGRGRATIDGRVLPLAALGDLGRAVLRRQGQHAALELVRPEAHVRFLDEAADLASAAASYGEAYEQVVRLIGRIELLSRGREELARRLESLRFDLDELDAAGVDDPEAIETLRCERERLRHIDRLRRLAADALEELDGGESPAVGRVERHARRIVEVAALDSELAAVAELLTESATPLREATRMLQLWAERDEDAPGRLDELEERLARLERLARKHRVQGPSDLSEVRRQIARELDGIGREASDPEAMAGDLRVAADAAWATCGVLEKARRKAASRFEVSVSDELGQLGMVGAGFLVRFDPLAAETASGPRGVLVRDGRRLEAVGSHAVEFHLEANAGEGALPLARFASGGELSRVMLALSSQSPGESGGTLLLDEVDAGIGGETADAVAARLRGLARGRQVICISHLAAIAAAADVHLVVEKSTRAGRTSSRVRRLEAAERGGEIARMLGGGEAAHGLAEAFLLRARPGAQVSPARGRRKAGGGRGA